MWLTISAVLGGIVLVGNAGAVLYKIIRPAFENQKQTEQNKIDIIKLKENQHHDLEAIKKQQEMDKMMIRSMVAILNHMIDGNHVEQMKETRDAIQDLMMRI